MEFYTALHKQRLTQFINDVTVYPVSCEKLAKGRSDLEWLDGVLAGGARVVQLRDKESDDRALYEKAKVFRKKTTEAGALLIVNNRVDIAMLAGADGVHLGNSDLPAEEVRKICPDFIIGISCNNEEQARTINKKKASYYNIGPLFPTTTKRGLHSFLGPAAIPRFVVHSDLPFTVMGGIKREHIPQLTGLNAGRIAVVTALTLADNIAEETTKWITEMKEGKRN